MPAWALEALEPFMGREDINLVLPSIPVNAQLGFAQVPTVSIVRVSPDPQKGEVYKVGARKSAAGQWENLYALGKTALDRLGSAAGVVFNTVRVDKRENPGRCEFACQIAVKNESGVPVMKVYHKELDITVVTEARRQERQAANEKAKAGDRVSPEKLEADLANEMAQFKKHIVARCETGAINRGIRGLLAIKSQWTATEIGRPFVVMRTDFRPTPANAAERMLMLKMGYQSAIQPLYGPEIEETMRAPRASTTSEATVIPDDNLGHDDEAPPDDTEDPPPAATVPVTPTTAAPKPTPQPRADDELKEMCEEAFRALAIGPAEKAKLLVANDFIYGKVFDALTEIAHERRKAAP